MESVTATMTLGSFPFYAVRDATTAGNEGHMSCIFTKSEALFKFLNDHPPNDSTVLEYSGFDRIDKAVAYINREENDKEDEDANDNDSRGETNAFTTTTTTTMKKVVSNGSSSNGALRRKMTLPTRDTRPPSSSSSSRRNSNNKDNDNSSPRQKSTKKQTKDSSSSDDNSSNEDHVPKSPLSPPLQSRPSPSQEKTKARAIAKRRPIVETQQRLAHSNHDTNDDDDDLPMSDLQKKKKKMKMATTRDTSLIKKRKTQPTGDTSTSHNQKFDDDDYESDGDLTSVDVLDGLADSPSKLLAVSNNQLTVDETIMTKQKEKNEGVPNAVCPNKKQPKNGQGENTAATTSKDESSSVAVGTAKAKAKPVVPKKTRPAKETTTTKKRKLCSKDDIEEEDNTPGSPKKQQKGPAPENPQRAMGEPRRRGRPPKDQSNAATKKATTGEPKRRGRPPKDPMKVAKTKPTTQKTKATATRAPATTRTTTTTTTAGPSPEMLHYLYPHLFPAPPMWWLPPPPPPPPPPGEGASWILPANTNIDPTAVAVTAAAATMAAASAITIATQPFHFVPILPRPAMTPHSSPAYALDNKIAGHQATSPQALDYFNVAMELAAQSTKNVKPSNRVLSGPPSKKWEAAFLQLQAYRDLHNGQFPTLLPTPEYEEEQEHQETPRAKVTIIPAAPVPTLPAGGDHSDGTGTGTSTSDIATVKLLEDSTLALPNRVEMAPGTGDARVGDSDLPAVDGGTQPEVAAAAGEATTMETNMVTATLLQVARGDMASQVAGDATAPATATNAALAVADSSVGTVTTKPPEARHSAVRRPPPKDATLDLLTWMRKQRKLYRWYKDENTGPYAKYPEKVQKLEEIGFDFEYVSFDERLNQLRQLKSKFLAYQKKTTPSPETSREGSRRRGPRAKAAAASTTTVGGDSPLPEMEKVTLEMVLEAILAGEDVSKDRNTSTNGTVSGHSETNEINSNKNNNCNANSHKRIVNEAISAMNIDFATTGLGPWFEEQRRQCRLFLSGKECRIAKKQMEELFALKLHALNPTTLLQPTRPKVARPNLLVERRAQRLEQRTRKENEHWESMYQELAQIFQEHGPRFLPKSVSPALNLWMSSVRIAYRELETVAPPSTSTQPTQPLRVAQAPQTSPGTAHPKYMRLLTPERIQRLHALGFIFRKRTRSTWTSFEDRVEHLKAFKAEFGHCIVPKSYNGHYGLGRWCSKQRWEYHKYYSDESERALSSEYDHDYGDDDHDDEDDDDHEEDENGQEDANEDQNDANENNTATTAVATTNSSKKKKKKSSKPHRYLTPERFQLLDSMGFTWMHGKRIEQTSRRTWDVRSVVGFCLAGVEKPDLGVSKSSHYLFC
jgi:hypothetical protein